MKSQILVFFFWKRGKRSSRKLKILFFMKMNNIILICFVFVFFFHNMSFFSIDTRIGIHCKKTKVKTMSIFML